MQLLTMALKEEHRQSGLYLEDDEDILYLKRGQETLARFRSTSVTIEALHEEADKCK